ncbi:MAG: bifunctional oligoribonuclease/PAP phosphatase NrnA [Candidatus Wallbacteria bacterium]|nr:bifunctional oligoribonuclease/PAP phosphatase NrnA [Candidatus Wallbacteria bacterium]
MNPGKDTLTMDPADASIDRVVRAIREGTDFLVTSHLRPDGDNLGGVTALIQILRQLGKPFRAVNRGPIPQELKFLPDIDLIELTEDTGPVADTCLVVDTPTLARTGYDWRERWPARVVVNIDHHPGNELYGQVNCVDVSAPASCHILYRVAKALGVQLDEPLATALFTGLMTDTGYFRYPNTTHETFRVASELIECGARHDRLYRAVYEERPLEAMRLLGLALSELSTGEDGRLAWVEVTRGMLRRSGAAAEDVAAIPGKVTTIRGVRLGITFEERGPRQTLVELRSVGDIDVGELARGFGGGGHKNAAGCNWPGPLSEIRDKLLPAAARLVAGRDVRPRSQALACGPGWPVAALVC